MNADFLRYRGLLAAAVGAGVVLGAAGIFLYHQLYAEKRRMLLQQDLARLDMTVSEMRSELDALRRVAVARRGHALRRGNNSKSVSTLDSDVDTDVDMYSAVGTDDGDDEFYDFSDDEGSGVFPLKCEIKDGEESNDVLAQLFDSIDQLLKGTSDDKKTAYNLLLENTKEHGEHAGLLWRLAKASHAMSIICAAEGQSERKKDYVLEGFDYARRALELDDTCAEAHKWFAVTVGSRGEFLSTKEKIEDGFIFKDHVDQALKLRPDDPSLHHLLGRFKYEVATLSWLERRIAGTLFAEPPEASYEEAIEDFLQAEALSPVPWKENKLLLAKCHLGRGDCQSAVDWLERAAGIPVSSPDDEAAEREVQALLGKYDSYRSQK